MHGGASGRNGGLRHRYLAEEMSGVSWGGEQKLRSFMQLPSEARWADQLQLRALRIFLVWVYAIQRYP